MTVLQHTGTTHDETSAGGERSAVLAVLDGVSRQDATAAQAVLAYAQMVSVVDGRPLRVLLVRPRLGFTTDAPVVAARQRRRRQVLGWLSTRSQTHVEVDELTVPRAIARRPAELWEQVLLAARVRGAACVVVPEEMPAAGAHDGSAPAPAATPTVIKVLARPRATSGSDLHGQWL